MAFQAGGTDYRGFLDQRRMADEGVTRALDAKGRAEKAQRDADAAASSGGGGGNKGLFGGGGTLGLSDIRLKNNIKLLKEGKDGDPNIYSFNYKWDSDTTWSGVMAQELLNTKHADAVKTNSDGFYMVDYHKLGIPMTQLST